MCGDRLLPARVGVDRLGVGSQRQGREPQEWSPRQSPGAPGWGNLPSTDEGDLVRETEPIVVAPPQGRSRGGRPRESWHRESTRDGRRRGRRPARFCQEQTRSRTCASQRLAILDYARKHDFRIDDLQRGDRLRTGFREAPSARRADERPPARRRPGRERTLTARPVAGSDRRPSSTPSPRPASPSWRSRITSASRGSATSRRRSHDHALRAVRRGRARPDLGAHPRGPRPGQVLGPEAGAPEGLAGRLTARRQVRTKSGASSSWACRRPPSPRSFPDRPLESTMIGFERSLGGDHQRFVQSRRTDT